MKGSNSDWVAEPIFWLASHARRSAATCSQSPPFSWQKASTCIKPLFMMSAGRPLAKLTCFSV